MNAGAQYENSANYLEFTQIGLTIRDMLPRPQRPRIALAVHTRSPIEEGIFDGVLDYAKQLRRWDFVNENGRPFLPFKAIDFTQFDGVIGAFSSPVRAAEAIEAGTVVVNTANVPANIPFPKVISDDQAVGRAGAEHLLARAFQQFGFFSHSPSRYAQDRLAGFRQTIEHAAGHVCHVLSDDAPELTHIDLRALQAWLNELPKPIGIMAANDYLGRFVLEGAVGLGLRVPEEVAVLGVDNEEWYTATVSTPLSSVEINTQQIGYRAAQVLDDLLSGKPAPPLQRVPPVRVIERRSTDVMWNQDPVVVAAVRFIEDRYGDPVTIDHLLEKVGVSRRNLENRMKRATGRTPYAALCRERVKRAKTMLTETRLTISQIARACGFDDQGNFGVMFKRETKLTPSQYRHQHDHGSGKEGI